MLRLFAVSVTEISRCSQAAVAIFPAPQ